ncbi:hypothetical protein CA158_24885 [Vibrio parahaemolyticus]|nr:hypothetical protein [Vibrio parahaemolyticus]EGR2351022.1 hypothetical protein [Vibrio parahaemolyticus]EGR2982791.1 hypothetical protein [Vibrio parahaemolyticus]OXD31009.1 hypothetical protein CA158_24885 [Vibrio parahaemolyticus]
MAFLVWGSFSVYGVQVECRGSVAHTLIGRYVYLKFKGLNILGFSSLSLWQFVPSRLSKSALST